jgi:hypothetical protein
MWGLKPAILTGFFHSDTIRCSFGADVVKEVEFIDIARF